MGPVLLSSASPWMDVFAGSLKKREETGGFLLRWRARLGVAILPAFPALPQLGAAAVACGGSSVVSWGRAKAVTPVAGLE